MRVIKLKKVNLNVKLISNESKMDEKLIGNIIQESKEITYQDKDELETRVKFNYEKNLLIRENDNLLLEYKFIKNKLTKGLITIKDLNQTIEIEIKTLNIKNEKNYIEIEYILENEKYLYIISMED